MGVSGDTEERVKELIGVDVDTIVVDTAHGHSRGVLDTISQLKAQNSNLSILPVTLLLVTELRRS